jgi:hypothetical protein
VSVRSASLSTLHRAGSVVDGLLERPREVLGTLIAAQIVGTIVLALSVEHNGWVWFQGGDQIVNTTTGWLVGQRVLPPTEVSYLWPLLQTPLTWITGPTFLQAMPPIVVGQVLVFGPIALLCVYGIAARIGGRLLGYWSALLWVVAPFAVIPLFVDRYHEKWIEQFLPQALGLTAMPDFPSMVLVLGAALFVVRSLPDARLTDALLAGVVAGAAGALKPPNYLFVVGAVLSYLVARRFRAGAAFLAALAPSILVVALWKDRGLGYLPALTVEQVQVAAGTGFVPVDLDRYLEFNWEHWRTQMDQLREFFWSARLAQWAPFAGLLAILRVRRAPIAALLGGWLGAFIAVKGFSERADIQANTFWRLLMPAWPAYLLLLAAIPLLVPTLAGRLSTRLHPMSAPPVATRWIVVSLLGTVGLPALATAASVQIAPPSPPALVQETESGTTILTPVDEGISLEVTRRGSGNELRWAVKSDWRANVFFRVYRADTKDDDILCVTAENAAWNCYLKSTPIATTREQTFVDPAAPEGALYRVGVGTNWADDESQGDIFALSPPVSAPR